MTKDVLRWANSCLVSPL